MFSATNKHNKILFVNIENINYSNYNFLKNIEFRAKQLNFNDYEYLLVDRGFNSKKVTNLIKKHTNIGLISPNKGKLAKIKQFNSDFEQEIYKNRWERSNRENF